METYVSEVFKIDKKKACPGKSANLANMLNAKV